MTENIYEKDNHKRYPTLEDFARLANELNPDCIEFIGAVNDSVVLGGVVIAEPDVSKNN